MAWKVLYALFQLFLTRFYSTVFWILERWTIFRMMSWLFHVMRATLAAKLLLDCFIIVWSKIWSCAWFVTTDSSIIILVLNNTSHHEYHVRHNGVPMVSFLGIESANYWLSAQWSGLKIVWLKIQACCFTDRYSFLFQSSTLSTSWQRRSKSCTFFQICYKYVRQLYNCLQASERRYSHFYDHR